MSGVSLQYSVEGNPAKPGPEEAQGSDTGGGKAGGEGRPICRCEFHGKLEQNFMPKRLYSFPSCRNTFFFLIEDRLLGC